MCLYCYTIGMAALELQHRFVPQAIRNLFVGPDERRRREAAAPFSEIPEEGFVVIDMREVLHDEELRRQWKLEAEGQKAALRAIGKK